MKDLKPSGGSIVLLRREMIQSKSFSYTALAKESRFIQASSTVLGDSTLSVPGGRAEGAEPHEARTWSTIASWQWFPHVSESEELHMARDPLDGRAQEDTRAI